MVSFYLRLRPPVLLLMMIVALLPQAKAQGQAQTQPQARHEPLQPSNHTSNHAVILSSSRFWFNYRHAVNALAIHNLIRQNGIPDENIILMLADEIPTNPRNPFKNQVFYETIPTTTTTKTNSRTKPGIARQPSSLIDSSLQIDYRGDEVTVDNLRNVLLGKSAPMGDNAPTGDTLAHRTTRRTGRRRVLHTDEHSNVLIYWTGHGGDSFFKFQDVEEITSIDIRRILQEMKFQSLLFLADTCQAFTLGNQLLSSSSPATDPRNVYMVGSSLQNENSYAHHADADLGVSVIERYTFKFIQFIQTHMRRNSQGTLSGLSLADALVNHFQYHQQGAHVGVTRTPGTKPLEHVLLSDFFAAPSTTTITSSSSTLLLDKPQQPTPTTSDWTRAFQELSL